jgi:hypothetical protein
MIGRERDASRRATLLVLTLVTLGVVRAIRNAGDGSGPRKGWVRNSLDHAEHIRDDGQRRHKDPAEGQVARNKRHPASRSRARTAQP